MSPFMYADKIKAPLLLIHGEADDHRWNLAHSVAANVRSGAR